MSGFIYQSGGAGSGAINDSITSASTTWSSSKIGSGLNGYVQVGSSATLNTLTLLGNLLADGAGAYVDTAKVQHSAGVLVTSASGPVALTSAGGTATVTSSALTTNVPVVLPSDPTQPLQACTKQYADAIAAGVTIKPAVLRVTQAALPSCVYVQTTVPGTLTGSAFGALSIDGSPVNVGERYLVTQQAEPRSDGCYTVTVAGDVSTAFVLTRPVDSDNSPVGSLGPGALYYCESGTSVGTQFVLLDGGQATPFVLNNPTLSANSLLNFTPYYSGAQVTLASAGGVNSLVTSGMGPTLGVKGLTAGSGVTLTPSGSAITVAVTGGLSLQSSYNASSPPSVVTSTLGGAVIVQRGSAADADVILAGENGAASTTFSLTGAGAVTASALTAPTLSNPTMLLVSATSPASAQLSLAATSSLANAAGPLSVTSSGALAVGTTAAATPVTVSTNSVSRLVVADALVSASVPVQSSQFQSSSAMAVAAGTTLTTSAAGAMSFTTSGTSQPITLATHGVTRLTVADSGMTSTVGLFAAGSSSITSGGNMVCGGQLTVTGDATIGGVLSSSSVVVSPSYQSPGDMEIVGAAIDTTADTSTVTATSGIVLSASFSTADPVLGRVIIDGSSGSSVSLQCGGYAKLTVQATDLAITADILPTSSDTWSLGSVANTWAAVYTGSVHAANCLTMAATMQYNATQAYSCTTATDTITVTAGVNVLLVTPSGASKGLAGLTMAGGNVSGAHLRIFNAATVASAHTLAINFENASATITDRFGGSQATITLSPGQGCSAWYSSAYGATTPGRWLTGS